MAHKLCHAFFLVRSFFPIPFHMEKGGKPFFFFVKVASGFADLRFTLSLHQIYIKAPVHAFYRPMVTYYCAQSGRVRKQAAYIQPFFRSTHSCRLFDCGRLVFNDCHARVPSASSDFRRCDKSIYPRGSPLYSTSSHCHEASGRTWLRI